MVLLYSILEKATWRGHKDGSEDNAPYVNQGVVHSY